MGNNKYGTGAERAALYSQIRSGLSELRFTALQSALQSASQLISQSTQQSVDADDPPPPPYSEICTVPCIPGGRWDLACNINVQGPFVQLNATGEPTWMQVACATTDGDRGYRRDDFAITQNLPEIMVTNQTYSWTCDANTHAGQLLMSKRDTISLRNLGERLLVFERTVMTKNLDRPTPKPREDPKGCLKIESQSSNIWTITGTDIYQVEGYENDVVIRSPEYLRLWDMAKGRFRWERKGSGGGRIWGLSQKFIVIKVGKCWLHERKTGNVHGEFYLPHYSAFIDFNENHHFGPVVSTDGLFIYKPCRKAIFVFEICDREVEFRIWESTTNIQGSLVLRGDLNNLEVEIIGQKPTWTKYEEKEPVYRNDFIKKRLL